MPGGSFFVQPSPKSCARIHFHAVLDERAKRNGGHRLMTKRQMPVRLVRLIVVVITIVLKLLGGVLFDFEVRVYRRIFRKLDEMVTEMEQLRA